MKILIHKSKYGDSLYDASTMEKQLEASYMIFLENEENGYYHDMDAPHSDWYKQAKEGNQEAAQKLVSFRSRDDYEYETVDIRKTRN